MAEWYDPEMGIEWTYTVSGGESSVGGGDFWTPAMPSSTIGAITIPSTLGGYPVTSIGWYAFYWCSGLTSVTIPRSVTSIEGYPFLGCEALTKVYVDKGDVDRVRKMLYDSCFGFDDQIREASRLQFVEGGNEEMK